MTNYDFIREFMDGNKKANANGHLMYYTNGNERCLVNYSTVILWEDSQGMMHFNTRKYSTTTSKIQSIIRRLLDNVYGQMYDEYDGGSANYWNYGYMGADNWTVRDLKERQLL